MHAHLPPYFYWFYQPASGIWEMRVDWKGGGKVISTTTPLFPSKQRIYILVIERTTPATVLQRYDSPNLSLPALSDSQIVEQTEHEEVGWVPSL